MSTQNKNGPLSNSLRAPFATATLLVALVTMPVVSLAHEPATRPVAASMPMDHAARTATNPHAGMSMTGDVDYDFAVNMRKHHQMALTMSEAQLRNGKNATLRTMATEIIAAQKEEIAELDRWIAARDRARPAPTTR